MNTATRIAKNTGFLYVKIIVNLLISLYSTRIVLHALGIENFGIYNLVAGVIAMLAFLNSSMAEASQRFMAIAHGEDNLAKQKKIFNVSFILHILIATIVILLLEIAGHFLFQGILEIPEDKIKTAKIVYQFTLASTFFTITKVPYDAVLNANENMFIVALFGIIESFIKLGMAFYIKYTLYDKLIMYGLLMALLSITMRIILYFYCHIKYDEARLSLIKRFDKALFSEMGNFAGWTFLIHSTFVVTMQGTTIILNSFFGVVVNAAQGIANQVSTQVNNFSSTMQGALNPVIVKIEGKKDRLKMLEASMLGNKISFFVISFLSIPVLIEMHKIFDLWLKEVPEFAVIFCQLHLIRLIITTLTQSFYVALGAIGKIKSFSILESLIIISVLPISYFMYRLGAAPETIYLNLIVMTLGMQSCRVYFLHKLGGLPLGLFFKNIVFRSLLVFVLSSFIAIIPLLLMGDGILRLFVVLMSSSVPLIILGYYIGFTRTERKQIAGALQPLLKKISKS